MNIGIIIQARMGSTRLPGKVMMHADKSNLMLDYTINQLKYSKKCKKIFVATSKLKRDDIIENHCEKIDIDVFRGKESDVLDRYFQCATKNNLSHIIRIPADKPLIDPNIIDMIIDVFLSNNFDYVANFGVFKKNNELVLDSTYPSGTEVEMMSYRALEYAWKNAIDLDDREHVTPYIYLNNEKFNLKILHLDENLSDFRYSLDYETDLLVIREIIKHVKNRPILMEDIVDFLKSNPKIKNLNKI